MWEFIGTSLLVCFAALTWINCNRIGALTEWVSRLQLEVDRLEKVREATKSQSVQENSISLGENASSAPLVDVLPLATLPDAKVIPHQMEEDVWGQSIEYINVTKTTDSNDAREKPRTFEQQFGGRAFVWLGGIALALAGFYMVKYSIESGIMTEQVRVIMGILFGFALLGGGDFIRKHPRIADGTRIAQALSGAGIADLYGNLFAATNLYHLIPSWLGFSSMAVITCTALVLSLRYGAPIAVLGLIGGFATPLMFHGDPNTPLLFGYLYLVFGGMIFVIRRQSWWWLSMPAALISFLWVVFWFFSGNIINDGIYLCLFLLAIGATSVLATHNVMDVKDEVAQATPSWLRHVGLGGSLILTAIVTQQSHFEIFEWGMFGLFSLASIGLAAFDHPTYNFAPWASLATTAVLLLSWTGADPTTILFVISSFFVLYTASSYLLAPRFQNAMSWASLTATSALTFYLVAFAKVENSIVAVMGLPHDFPGKDIWTDLAFLLALFFIVSVKRPSFSRLEANVRQVLQSIYAVPATSFIALGFAIMLHQDLWVFSVAGQILAMSWLYSRVELPALRSLTAALTVLFGILMLPEAVRLLEMALDVTPNDASAFTHAFSLKQAYAVSTLMFRFGLPAVMLAIASWFVRLKKDDHFVSILEIASVIIFSTYCYYLTDLLFSAGATQLSFMSRGVFTDLLMLLSLGSFYLGRRFRRLSLSLSGIALCGLALTRIIGFDLLIHNPLWSHQWVGEWPFFNGLLLTYGAPTLLLILIKKELVIIDKNEFAQFVKFVSAILAFVFVSFTVRQCYHGAYLATGIVTSAEIYTYSAVWLLMGIALLFVGTMRHDRVMRITSLVIMLGTVGKVFLYDASELTGLWRVLSFFGLGLSLLGLSWFYSRFVFVTSKQDQ